MSWNNPGKFTLQGVKSGIGYGRNRYQSIKDYFGDKPHTVSFNGKVEFIDDSIVIGLRGHIYEDKYDSRYGRYFPQVVGMSDYTDIATLLPNGAIFVNNGGYAKATTKKWINLFTGLGIHQKDFQWYVGDMPIDRYALKTPNGLIFTDASIRREKHGDSEKAGAVIRHIWQHLEQEPESHGWTGEQWDEFITALYQLDYRR